MFFEYCDHVSLLVSVEKRRVGASSDGENYFDDFERLRLRGIDELRVSYALISVVTQGQ